MFHHFNVLNTNTQTFLGLDPNSWVAIGTFLVVVVALFQDWIRSWWNLSQLNLSIKLEPPDCHQIRLSNAKGEPGLNSIYLRIRVNNESDRKAENVEVMLSELWRTSSTGQEIVKTFLPMNLKWSHYGTASQNIPAGVFKHCDLGMLFPFPDGGTRVKFDTIVQPNQVSGNVFPNIIEPGKYQFVLVATADNAYTNESLWELEFDRVWIENETLMLTKHIKVRRLN